jgi:hypothetical protein
MTRYKNNGKWTIEQIENGVIPAKAGIHPKKDGLPG